MIPISFPEKEITSPRLTTIFSLFGALEKGEARKFRAFLNSRYFNKNEQLNLLFEQLLKSYREKATRINGRPFFQKLFGDIDIEKGETKLDHLLAKLEALFLDFFILQEIEDSTILLRQRVLTTSLRKRRLTADYQKAAHHFSKLLEAKPPSIATLLNAWWLEHHHYFNQYAERYEVDSAHFQQAFHLLTQFYQATVLCYYAEYLNRNYLVQDKLKLEQIEAVYQNVLDYDPTSPIAQIYLRMIRLLLQRDDEQVYREFKSSYETQKEQLSKTDRLIFIKMGINVCNYNYEGTWEKAPQELFYWAKEGIREDFFLVDGVISEGDYLNSALSAASAGAFDHQLEFMNKYRSYLEPEYRDRAYYLAMAYYHFHRKEYLLTAKLLHTHFPPHTQAPPMYLLRVKSLLCRTYLVLFVTTWDYQEEYEKALDAFRKLIERKEILTEDRRLPYEIFIRYCRSIVSLHKQSVNKSREAFEIDKKTLLNELSREKTVASRRWLRGFIQDLTWP